MASTYTPIATTTLGSATSNITFTGISSAYTDLVLIINGGQVTADGYWAAQVGNGSIDTGSNYSITDLKGNGSAASSSRQSNQTQAIIQSTNSGSLNDNLILSFQNYANTSVYKTFLSRGNTAEYRTGAYVCLWRSTSAINQIKIFGYSNLLAGTTATLYGIAAA